MIQNSQREEAITHHLPNEFDRDIKLERTFKFAYLHRGRCKQGKLKMNTKKNLILNTEDKNKIT